MPTAYPGAPGYGAPGHPKTPTYSPPGYSPPGYGPPGYGPPGHPAPRPRTTSLPLAAMITGGVALILGNLISMGVLGIVGGIVGIVLGIVGARRAKRWGAGGFGLAAGAIGVSALSVLVGSLVLVAALPDFIDGWNQGWEDSLEQDQEQEQAQEQAQEAEQEAEVEADAADVPNAGEQIPAEWMNPDGPWLGIPSGGLPLGQVLTINDYTVSIVSIDLEADATLAAAHTRNPLPYGQYILVTVSIRNQSVLERSPLDDLLVSYPALDDYIYDETSCAAQTARPVTAVGPLAFNEEAEYDVCFDVPSYAIGEAMVLVHDLSTEGWDAQMWLAG